MVSKQVASELEARFGATRGSPASAVDGRIPAAVIQPLAERHVAEVLAHANLHGLAVIALGGGTHRHIGNPPTTYDIGLDLTRVTGIVEFEPADLTITCRAGMTLGELRRETAVAGMQVPFDSSIPDEATIGGALAANVFGAERISLGTPRDFTIGMQVVTADGKITRAGGKVVKNVAGYDLCKLYIGSLGTLGVITESTFKLAPLPESTAAVTLWFGAAIQACSVARTARRRGLSIAAAMVTRCEEGWRLTMRLAGSSRAVERSIAEIAILAEPAGGNTTDTRGGSGEVPSTVVRLSVLATKLPDLLERVDLAKPMCEVEAWPTVGTCRIEAKDASPSAIRSWLQMASELGGRGLIERCPSEVKTFDVFGASTAASGLMREIKRTFDPYNILSPGRQAGGI